MENIKILIVDDHQMVRDGIRSMLEVQKGKYKFIIDEAETGEEGIEKVIQNHYDLIIMDYQLPGLNGVEATKEILIYKHESKILALSNYDEYMHITNILKAGAKGFVLKNIGPDELVNAIQTILKGKNYYSNDVAIKLININDDDFPENNSKKRGTDPLSKREVEVLKLIVNAYTSNEIAKELYISKTTVATHRRNMLNKLNLRNTAGLIKYAMDSNLLDQNNLTP